MDNEERANVADDAAKYFAEQLDLVDSGDWDDDRQAIYVDLIADTLHACHRQGFVPQVVLRMATEHFMSERGEAFRRHNPEHCGWDGLGQCPTCGEDIGRVV